MGDSKGNIKNLLNTTSSYAYGVNNKTWGTGMTFLAVGWWDYKDYGMILHKDKRC